MTQCFKLNLVNCGGQYRIFLIRNPNSIGSCVCLLPIILCTPDEHQIVHLSQFARIYKLLRSEKKNIISVLALREILFYGRKATAKNKKNIFFLLIQSVAWMVQLLCGC